MECQKVSNLRARDHNILTCGFLPSQKKNRLKVLDSSASTAVEENEDHIRVYLRIKKIHTPEDIYEVLNDKTLLCKVPEGTNSIKNIRSDAKMSRTFNFSKIFNSDSCQATIFNSIVKTEVLSVINGFNSNILTYGTLGSGKMYTIVGTPDQPGLIPRALEYLYRTLPPLPKEPLIKPTAFSSTIQLSDSERRTEKSISNNILNNSIISKHKQIYRIIQESLSNEPIAELLNNTTDISLAVWVSFVEIHNEWLYDLLVPDPTRGQSRKKIGLGYCNGDAYIKDVTFIHSRSSLQAYQLLQYGLQKLQYAATPSKCNRSHFIFTLKLISTSNAQNSVPSVSTFNFCNLAGSERSNKAPTSAGSLNEASKLNNSLVVLGRCINLIRKAQIHPNTVIPFRESKLTQLLQKALLGHEAISILININPIKNMFDETQHVLNFSAITGNTEQHKSIATTFSSYMSDNVPASPIETEMSSRNSLTNELQLQIQELREKIQKEKVDAKEEREYIIATYKNHLDQAHRYWENRSRELEYVINKNRAIELKDINEKLSNMGISTEKGTIETIIIDSDSSDEENVNEIGNNQNNISYSKESFSDVQGELMRLRQELHLKDGVVKQLCTEIDESKEDIEAANQATQELQIKYKEIIEDLRNTLNQKNKILENISIWSDDHFKYTEVAQELEN